MEGGPDGARLREISERLQAIAAELEGEVADDQRAAQLARRGRRARTRRSPRRTAVSAGRQRPIDHPPLMYPDDLRSLVDAELERLASPRQRRPPASTRRCATRCSPAASGCARSSPSPPPAPLAPSRSGSCRSPRRSS